MDVTHRRKFLLLWQKRKETQTLGNRYKSSQIHLQPVSPSSHHRQSGQCLDGQCARCLQIKFLTAKFPFQSNRSWSRNTRFPARQRRAALECIKIKPCPHICSRRELGRLSFQTRQYHQGTGAFFWRYLWFHGRPGAQHMDGKQRFRSLFAKKTRYRQILRSSLSVQPRRALQH